MDNFGQEVVTDALQRLLHCLCLLLSCSPRLSYNSDAILNSFHGQTQILHIMSMYCFKIKLVALSRDTAGNLSTSVARVNITLEMYLQFSKNNQLLAYKLHWINHSCTTNQIRSPQLRHGRREALAISFIPSDKTREEKGKWYLQDRSWSKWWERGKTTFICASFKPCFLYRIADAIDSTEVRCVLWPIINIKSVTFLWNLLWNQEDFFLLSC